MHNTVYVSINRYNTVRNDWNRKGGGVACYIRSKISYSRKACLSDNLENIFIDFLFPKTKPISEGIIYKLSSQTRFLEQMITEFEALELNNELCILETLTQTSYLRANTFLIKLIKLTKPNIIVKTFHPKLKMQWVLFNIWFYP